MAKKKQIKKSDDGESSLRKNAIFAAVSAGHTQQEIAEDLGIDRKTIYRALKSEDAKRIVSEGRAGLISHINLAVETLADAMNDRHSNMGVAVNAAIQLLKGIGALTEQSQITIMKPFIYENPDGGEIVMSHKPINDEEE